MAAAAHADLRRSAHASAALMGFVSHAVLYVASLHRCMLRARCPAATQPGTAAVKFLDGGADEGVALWDPSATLWPSNDRTDKQRSAQTNKQTSTQTQHPNQHVAA
jgi:hypothetical protein